MVVRREGFATGPMKWVVGEVMRRTAVAAGSVYGTPRMDTIAKLEGVDISLDTDVCMEKRVGVDMNQSIYLEVN